MEKEPVRGLGLDRMELEVFRRSKAGARLMEVLQARRSDAATACILASEPGSTREMGVFNSGKFHLANDLLLEIFEEDAQ